MRNLTIILIIISLFACNTRTEKSDSSTEAFEKILGEKETNYLNEIVANLDNFLASNYPDKKPKFESYLVDFSKLKVNEYWKIDPIKLKKYKESNLFGRYDTIFPDSVWFDGLSYNIKYPNFDLVEEIIPIKRKNEEIHIDSTINALKNDPKILLIEQSNLFLALDSIQKSDSLIMTYLDAKEVIGNLSPSILAGGLMYYLTENNEYFAKRILVLDMYE